MVKPKNLPKNCGSCLSHFKRTASTKRTRLARHFAYQTAYMKAHYPVQYMTAVLQAEADDTDKVAEIVHECGRMGIEVLPPDVNESFRNFAMVSQAGREWSDPFWSYRY